VFPVARLSSGHDFGGLAAAAAAKPGFMQAGWA